MNNAVRCIGLSFYHHTAKPTKPEGESWPMVILYNQCDGYHLAFARFYEDGEFDGFYDWANYSTPYEGGTHFCAWALLPPSTDLYEPFADQTPVNIIAQD